MFNFRNRHRGISLIEILIAIAVIGVLVGMTVPAVGMVRRSVRKTESANNLRQLALAAHQFQDVAKFLPPTCGWDNRVNKPFENGANGTAFFHMMPFLEQDALYRKCFGKLHAPCSYPEPEGPANLTGVSAFRANRIVMIGKFTNPKVFINQLDDTATQEVASMYSNWGSLIPAGTPRTSYLANKSLTDKRLSTDQIRDGATATILFTEGRSSCKMDRVLGTTERQFDVTDKIPMWDYFSTQDATGKWRYPAVDNFTIGATTSYYPTGRENIWAVGSEMVGFSLDTTWDKAKPVNMLTTDWTSGVMKYEDRELQTMIMGYRWSDCPGVTVDYVYELQFQNLVAGWIPAVYQVDGVSFQDPTLQKNPTWPTTWCGWSLAQSMGGPMQVARADGSITTIRSDVNVVTYNAALTPNGGELIPADFWE